MEHKRLLSGKMISNLESLMKGNLFEEVNIGNCGNVFGVLRKCVLNLLETIYLYRAQSIGGSEGEKHVKKLK